MAIDNLPGGKDEGQGGLSGAYIRSLVKQLTSSSNPPNTNNTNTIAMAKQNDHVGHKKQVRRRLHTSRPYQERLLNMAEARKEIVTALKFHRAAMKQANEKKQQPPPPQQQQPSDQYQYGSTPFPGVENSLYYPSYYYTTTNNNNNNSCPNWFISSSPPPLYETLNIPLPNQTLGLNLNLQAFTNLDTNLKYYSSTSSSSSSGDPTVTTAAIYGVGPTNNGTDHHMHPALDEEEIAEMRSIGEQHQIEWDDTLNLVKSAWWLKFLKTTSDQFGKEIKGMEERDNIDVNNNREDECPFEGEFMEFPAWLSANESFLQQHLDDCCSEDYLKDTTLPWMDIGDIDGMDDEWLS